MEVFPQVVQKVEGCWSKQNDIVNLLKFSLNIGGDWLNGGGANLSFSRSVILKSFGIRYYLVCLA